MVMDCYDQGGAGPLLAQTGSISGEVRSASGSGFVLLFIVLFYLFGFLCFFFLLGTGDIHRAQDSLLLFFNQI